MGCPSKVLASTSIEPSGFSRSRPRIASATITEPSVMTCKPTGRPPVFPSVLTTPDASSLIMRPSSRPVTQLPSTAHDTSSGPSPGTSINATSDSSEFTAKPSTKPGLAGGIQTCGSIGDLTNATASTSEMPSKPTPRIFISAFTRGPLTQSLHPFRSGSQDNQRAFLPTDPSVGAALQSEGPFGSYRHRSAREHRAPTSP